MVESTDNPGSEATETTAPKRRRAAGRPAGPPVEGVTPEPITADDAAEKKPAKKAAKPKAKRKPNAAFMKPVTPSATLAAIVGDKPQPRTEITKRVWDYIKKNGLQDKKNKRQINADAKLQPIFGRASVTMFEMTKLVSKHLK